ncbi:uncharacterized protein LOC132174049 [Corylus avellana]|uniref:uncharacterized protein LOC132174049 n=1 Tax=Corylus avellana TaxID=13451 RepID=UPI00286CB12E|nr:uncharacterized protein LOC132174049 [Corylus avellana]
MNKEVRDLQEKYEKMAFLIGNGENQSLAKDLMQYTNLPFTDRVMRFPLPDKFKMPWVNKYDGSTDPYDHMVSFRAHIILHDTPDEIACRAFPLTLEGIAKEWFGGLSPKSVDNFDFLRQQFLGQFIAVQKRKKNPVYLLSIIQGKTESLKDNMLRFNREKLMAETPDEQIFTNKAEEFINQEETISALTKSKPEESKHVADSVRITPKALVEKKKTRDHQKVIIPKKKIELPPKQNQQQQYVGWTPLNTTVYKVFMEVRKDPSFRWPGKMKALPQNWTTHKLCEYHNDHRHYTEDCISLRFEIEKFLRNGKLLKFVAEEKGREKNPQNEQSHRSSQNLEPNNNNFRNQRQKRDEPRPSKAQKLESGVLSFSEEDVKEVSKPHDDALVITLTVANHAIHRVLVDNGSLADILYWTVVQKLGVGRGKLKPFLSPLIGFAGERVQPIGMIYLPVTAGTAPKQSTIMVDFLVIDQPSAYNVIIGRRTLNQLKAATSTYYLKMKFSTTEGVGEVKGDQVVARKCYNTSLKRCPELALLTIEAKEVLIRFLQENLEVFAWSPKDMPGIDPKDIVHHLNINLEIKPVKQKRRKFALERNMAIAKEIFMHPFDQDKTAFITDRGLYCYKVMPFGLKNAEATYQRLVNKMFQEQIGKNMKVYVDDMLVKSRL